jgi:hypothetical protein
MMDPALHAKIEEISNHPAVKFNPAILQTILQLVMQFLNSMPQPPPKP